VKPADLQSAPFSHSGTYPNKYALAKIWHSPLSRQRVSLKMIARDKWSWLWDSNPQPADYKSAALPIELNQHMEFKNPKKPD
jgi:hypothetical protein